ncbi:MAG: T9SS type A sorting domain-containing protein [Saprospiraceae bacterium]
MKKLLPLSLLLLACAIAGISTAQSRSGNVLTTFGNGDGDRFGATVSLSNNGTRIAVMAPDNGRFGTGSPQAEVYELQGGSWVKLGNTFTDYFTSPLDEEATITLSGGGTTVATGEPAFNTVQNLSTGRIVTSRYGTSGWATIGDELNGIYRDAQLGKKIALLTNGTQMMTANFGGDENDRRGAFNRVLTTTEWITVGTQPILQSTGEESLSGIALSEQGLVVGMGLNKGVTAPGEVQFFQFTADWVSRGSITGSANGDGFGESIAMGSNGNIIAIGAPYDGNGKVRVYDDRRDQIGSTIDAPAGDQTFGYSLDISEDGNTLAIGAPANDPTNVGMGNAYVYELVNGDWALTYTFRGTVMGEQVGQSISISDDGMHLAIGRPGFEAAGQSDAGQVDVYVLDGSTSTSEEAVLELQAYPNPTSAELHIEGLPQGESTIFIRDAIGRLVMTATNVTGTVNVAGISNGYYLLEVQSTEGVGRIPFVKK